jgi:hypothetical protein
MKGMRLQERGGSGLKEKGNEGERGINTEGI